MKCSALSGRVQTISGRSVVHCLVRRILDPWILLGQDGYLKHQRRTCNACGTDVQQNNSGRSTSPCDARMYRVFCETHRAKLTRQMRVRSPSVFLHQCCCFTYLCVTSSLQRRRSTEACRPGHHVVQRPRSSGASERDSAARRPAGPRRGADCEECNQELVQEGTQGTVSRGQQGEFGTKSCFTCDCSGQVGATNDQAVKRSNTSQEGCPCCHRTTGALPGCHFGRFSIYLDFRLCVSPTSVYLEFRHGGRTASYSTCCL